MIGGQIAAIQRNLGIVQENITLAAQKVSRSPNDIHLVVVTKSHPPEILQAAVLAGAKNLGENYAEEALVKIHALGGKLGVNWHMIGHVQSRKAELVAQYFDWMHSLDSVKLAKRLEKRLAEVRKTLPVLLEFNVAEEDSKFGWKVDDPNLLLELEEIAELPHLDVCGLMTMPPLMKDPQENRKYFKQLRELRDKLAMQFPRWALTELSMGTSSDYAEAVMEGATLVRIGTAILGPRLGKTR